MSATALKEKAAEIAESAPPLSPSPLAHALVEALKELTVVGADRTANAGSYSYKYAAIEDVVKLTRPVLAKHGLVALTPVHDHGSGLACTVILLHDSGERLDLGPFPFDHGRDAQSTGSAVTYHRRYALIAALGMAAGDDDDGAGAHPKQPAFEWTAGAVKAELLNLCAGDKAKAKQVWTDMDGDDIDVCGPATAKALLDEWEHLPADPTEAPT